MHQVRIKLTLVIFHEIHLLLLIVVAKSIRLFLINFVSSELAVEIRLRLTKIVHMIHLLAKWSLKTLLMVHVHKTVGWHLVIVNFLRLLVLDLAHGRRIGVCF